MYFENIWTLNQLNCRYKANNYQNELMSIGNFLRNNFITNHMQMTAENKKK